MSDEYPVSQVLQTFLSGVTELNIDLTQATQRPVTVRDWAATADAQREAVRLTRTDTIHG